MSKSFRLIISIIVCQAAGVIGSFFTRSSVGSWYSTINKPDFTPPGWIFAPVWITLYLMMGISLYLVWQKSIEATQFSRKAMLFFAIQLALNTLWSILFFGLHSPILGSIEIALLWLFILLTMIEFRKITKAAFWLLVPYFLWVSFASVLTFSIWKLN